MDTKSILRHELLNILTIIDLSLSEEGAERKEGNKDLVEAALVLIEYEDVFLGKKLKFFKREAPLKEFLGLLLESLGEDIKEKKITVSFLEKDVTLSFDQHYIGKALTQILKKIFSSATEVVFTFDEKEKVLSISHNAGDIIGSERKSLQNFIKKGQLRDKNIPFIIAIEILDMYGARPKFSKDKINIQF